MINSAEIESIEKARGVLRAGGVILAPTDTVWGLMGDFENKAAVDKILALKRSRPRHLALLCADIESMKGLGLDFSDAAEKLSRLFWPGAITLVVRSNSVRVRYIAGQGNAVGVRIPDAEQLQELIRRHGNPLAATSANYSGNPPARNSAEIASSISKQVDHIFDFAINPSGLASTVIDCTGKKIKILRQGAISSDQIFKSGVGDA